MRDQKKKARPVLFKSVPTLEQDASSSQCGIMRIRESRMHGVYRGETSWQSAWVWILWLGRERREKQNISRVLYLAFILHRFYNFVEGSNSSSKVLGMDNRVSRSKRRGCLMSWNHAVAMIYYASTSTSTSSDVWESTSGESVCARAPHQPGYHSLIPKPDTSFSLFKASDREAQSPHTTSRK